LVNKFYSRRGGAERCLFDQERWLRQAGHDVHVFSQRGELDEPSADARFFVDGVQFDGTRADAVRGVHRLFWSKRVKRALSAALEQHRPELAILHNVYHHLGPVVPLTLRAAKVPSLMLFHDHKAVCPAYSAWRAGKRCTECRGQRFHQAARYGCGGSLTRGSLLAAESYWQWDVLQSYAKIQGFLAPSPYLLETLKEMGFPFPVALLRNAVDVPSDAPSPIASRRHVGFSGRLSPEKGVEVVVRAAAQLMQFSFRVAGAGPARPGLEALARSLGAENVTFLGHLEPDALEREIASWRIAIVPSLSPENAPFAALDAMNHGVPVVGSAVGGLPELLTDRGTLFEPGDVRALVQTLASLYPDEARLEAMAANALKFIEAECRPPAHVSRLLKLARLATP
jgi:glycosyltransferase involved in cell wall biosynthesis